MPLNTNEFSSKCCWAVSAGIDPFIPSSSASELLENPS